MEKYELIMIVDATIPQGEKDTIVKESNDLIAKNSGKIINSQVWIEKQRFSFRMKKRTEGTYYLINFESPQSAVAQIRESLRLNEKVIRSLITKVE